MEVTLKELLMEIENKWERPSIDDERDAIESVETEYDMEIGSIVNAFPNGNMRMLPDSIWQSLQNTDSTKTESFYDLVQVIQKQQKKDPSYDKDWKGLRDVYSDDIKKMKAPIVVKHKGDYILVSGNARLMVAKAMKISPFVFLVQV